MSGIYIPGMEMPDKCGHCRFASAFDCGVTGNFISTHSIRQPDCPLVHVPEHRDLMDRDEFIAKLHLKRARCGQGPTANAITMCMNDARDMPTIIPASKEEQT